MATLDDKIRAFLEAAGYDYDESASSSIQLIRFFEQEYDANILRLMEQEWLKEQIHHDTESGLFDEVRKRLTKEQRPGFDRLVRAILAGQAPNGEKEKPGP